MKAWFPVLTIAFLMAQSCKSNKPKNMADSNASDTSRFYALHTFFKDQIEYVDLRDFPIYRITIKNGKKDSAALNREEFIRYAGIFLTRDLSSPQVKSLYRESVFRDQSTGSITLNYIPVNYDATVQNIDILLDETTSLVKRVFIRSEYRQGDTTIAEQCNWKANKSFQVNKTFTTNNGYHSTEYNYINWNDKP